MSTRSGGRAEWAIGTPLRYPMFFGVKLLIVLVGVVVSTQNYGRKLLSKE